MADELKVPVGAKSHDQYSVESWIKKHNLSHLQQLLVKQDLNTLEKCVLAAAAPSIEEKINVWLKGSGNNDSDNADLISLEHAFNSLLKLKETSDFLSKLNELSRLKLDSNETSQDIEWTLVFVDCDNIESLLREKEISVDSVENSINLLHATIYRLIANDKNKDKDKDKDKIFGYHLGGDLFALFVNDNCSMDKSKEICQYLIKIMENKDKSSLTISAGIGIRRLFQTSKEAEENEEKQGFNFKELQRQWVVRAHTNLLRAKENGKNCYVFNLVCGIYSILSCYNVVF